MIALESLAAFLTGVAGVLGAGYSLRRARREERERCQERIDELNAAYHRGVDEGLGLTRRDS